MSGLGEKTQARLAARSGGIDMRRARAIVHDLHAWNPVRYFIDFTVSAVIGYGALAVFLTAPDFSAIHLAAFACAGFALFRAGVFMHEIVHMPAGTMIPFKIYWSLLYGLPMLSPWFMYANHRDHHNQLSFGTAGDGEYQPFAHGSILRIVLYFAQVPVIPILGILRFLILTPASLFHPGLRRWVLANSTSYVSNFRYRRQMPAGERHGWWVVQELICSAWLWFLVILFTSGELPLSMLGEIYLVGCLGVGLNWLRNLAGHRFRSLGEPMSHLDQFEDSVTIAGNPFLHELFFPVGLRYHALHHLFPAMPYHNLGEAHRRLAGQLPASYHRTVHRGLGAVFGLLLADIRRNRERPSVPA
jgi:fatty acid desaturase